MPPATVLAHVIEKSLHTASPIRRTGRGAALAAAVLLAGCQQPWYAASKTSSDRIAEAGDRLAEARQAAVPPRSSLDPSTTISGVDPFEGNAAQPDPEKALTALVAELQAAEDIDPATRAELIADLRAADSAHWPLIVQQLRSTLAYRRQSAELETDSAAEVAHGDDPAVAARATPPPGGALATASDGMAAAHATASQTATSEPNDIGSAFTADADAIPAVAGASSGNAGTAAAVLTTLPEPVPEPAEASLATAAEASLADTMPPTQDPEPAEIMAAAYQEPIYQTPGSVVSTSDSPSADEPPASELSWEELLDGAIARLEEETSAAPATSGEIGRHARLRLLHLAAGDDTAALALIEGVPPNQQDFWGKQLFGLSAYLDDAAQPDLRQRAAVSQRHLQEATDLLGEMAVLEVRNLAFCSEARGFGAYEPLQQPRFSAGQQVKLYAEVANYRSEPTEDGFRTLLATSYEVLDESDRRVDSGEFPQVEDICRSRRRDFHIQYGVNLPTRVYPGKYRLQLTIEDMQSRKLGRSSVEFEIVDDSKKTL